MSRVLCGRKEPSQRLRPMRIRESRQCVTLCLQNDRFPHTKVYRKNHDVNADPYHVRARDV